MKNIYLEIFIVSIIAFFIGYAFKSYNITFKRIFGYIYRKIKKPRKSYGPWAIGMYSGENPFSLNEIKGVQNPIITGEDVSDFDASFVADPFIVKYDDSYYMFFEALQRQTQKGVISYATSEDGVNWSYKKTIIEEPFHLSYPYIFKWEGDYFMTPESNEDYTVRLYKASSFPDKWEFVNTLLSGYDFVDPSIFRYNGKWWMFVSTSKSSFVNLYYSDTLESGWKPHPQNPIRRNDKHNSRPGGRVIVYENNLYRLAQDTYPVYGSNLFAFEIQKITENEYIEKPIKSNPIFRKPQKGWNAKGMHHLDLIKTGNIWLATVDGRWT